jgi:hypothetical protein
VNAHLISDFWVIDAIAGLGRLERPDVEGYSDYSLCDTHDSIKVMDGFDFGSSNGLCDVFEGMTFSGVGVRP